jgi:hypothetical protein
MYQLCCPGKDQLRALGITKVYDLRSVTEIEKYNSPLPTIDEVDVLRTPVFEKEDYSPEMMAKCVRVWSLYFRLVHLFGLFVRVDGLSCIPVGRLKCVLYYHG